MDNIQKLTYNHNKSATKKKTMMICEDEPDIRLLFGLVFGSKYDIILVDSGEDCTERFIEEKNRENKIHLILLDYKLGGMQALFHSKNSPPCNAKMENPTFWPSY